MNNCHIWEEQGGKITADNKSIWCKGPGVVALWEARVPGVELEKGGIDCHRRVWRNNMEPIPQDFVNHNMEFGLNLQTVGLCKQRNNRNGKCFKLFLSLLWGEDKNETREIN